MILLIAQFTRRAGGYYDSKIFFRGLFLILLVWAFVMPEVAITGALDVLEAFARFCAGLAPDPLPLMQAIAAVAGILAAGQLYGISKKPKPPVGPVLEVLKVKIGEAIDTAKKALDE